jgi:prepilin-type N-terminal cleavage/methylation domain-containing protein
MSVIARAMRRASGAGHRPLRRGARVGRSREAGFTLIELLVAMAISTVVGFAQNNISRAEEETRVSQSARDALEKLVLELHSGCVAPRFKPILEGSTDSKIRFISQSGESSLLETVTRHEVDYEYSEQHGGELVDHYLTSNKSTTNEWTFPSETPKQSVLVTHIEPAPNPERVGATLPYFQYYRYYEPTDEGYEAGKLDPKPLTATATEPLSAEAAAKVAKVTVTFAVAPSEKHPTGTNASPITLQDSVVYRLTPASTAESPAPMPCI